MEYAYGALMGACCGDAAGAVLEFSGEPTLNTVKHALRMPGGGHHKVASGQITDDGELTISLANGLIRCNDTFNIDYIADEYVKWYKSTPFDVGMTTFTTIGAAVRGESNPVFKRDILEKKGSGYAMHWAATSGEVKMSKANGSLMRCTPLGIWARNQTPEVIAQISRADSGLTHSNSACCDSVACYSIAIAHLINNPGDNRGAFAAAKQWVEKEDPEVLEWLLNAEKNIVEPFYPNSGFVKIGFSHAFRHLYLGTDYLDAIGETLLGGGDTDTNACIVGGLLGALHGISKIPQSLIEPVLSCNTKLGRPRPEFLHPKNLRHMTETLLAVSENIIFE